MKTFAFTFLFSFAALANVTAVQCLQGDGGINCVACKKTNFGNSCKPVELSGTSALFVEAEAKSTLPDPKPTPKPDTGIPAVPAASGALAIAVAAFAAGRRSKNNEA